MLLPRSETGQRRCHAIPRQLARTVAGEVMLSAAAGYRSGCSAARPGTLLGLWEVMLKHKRTKKLLHLARETVRNMRPAELRQIIGGAGDPTIPGSSGCESGGRLTCVCHEDY